MVIDVKNVSFSYPRKPEKKVLRDVSFSLRSGDFAGITGSTGSGKTTLAYCFNGLIPHAVRGNFSGSVKVRGLDTRKHKIAELAKKVGLVFQDPDWQLFSLTVRDEISFGLKNLKLGNIEKRIGDAIRMVGLEGYEDTEPYNLSQGQKQKLCIASVLAMEPDVIVLDEPTSSLDYRNTMHIYDILRGLNKKGKTVVVVEHNTDMLSKYANRVLLMEDGSVVKHGPVKEVFADRKMLERLGIKIPGGGK